MATQRLDPTDARPLQPGKHGGLASRQCFRDRLAAPPRFVQLPGAQPSPLAHILTHGPPPPLEYTRVYQMHA